MAEIFGKLNTQAHLDGVLAPKTKVRGHLSATTGLLGELSTNSPLSGVLSSSTALAGVLTIPASIGNGDPYTGAYEVTPKAYDEQVLNTANKYMTGDVTVHIVPYYETSNLSGETVYIASEV